MNPPPTNRIRRLEPRDLEDAARICNTAVGRGESTYGPDGLTPEELRAALFDVPAQFESYVWDSDGGSVAGWAALMRHTNRDIYDTVAELTVFVADEHRRRGVGHALVRHAMGRADELGFRVLLFILQPEPAHTLAWALRLGFRNVGWLVGVLPVGEQWRDVMVFERYMKGAS